MTSLLEVGDVLPAGGGTRVGGWGLHCNRGSRGDAKDHQPRRGADGHWRPRAILRCNSIPRRNRIGQSMPSPSPPPPVMTAHSTTRGMGEGGEGRGGVPLPSSTPRPHFQPPSKQGRAPT
eukprot:352598-Chlamydomonas_euryale.AAC.11